MTFLRALPLLPLLALACLQTPSATAESDAKKSEPAKTEAPAQPEAPAKAEPTATVGDGGLKPTTEPLTPEEERLIAADVATLTPDERRARAHALRKKIMLNPESDSAQALQDARAAALAGEVDPTPTATDAPPEPDKGLVIQAPPHDMKPPAEAPAQ